MIEEKKIISNNMVILMEFTDDTTEKNRDKIKVFIKEDGV